MAISQEVAVIPTAVWQQGDARDPLGVWGFRLGVTGDATAGGIKVGATEPAGQKGAYIYTCYSLQCVQLTGTQSTGSCKSRLLTGWPNVDPIPDVQGYGSMHITTFSGSARFTAPISGPGLAGGPLVQPQDRFLLLFDPRQTGDLITLVELELADNVDTATYSFEGYGYFWDRGVLDAPGGPRHPGSS